MQNQKKKHYTAEFKAQVVKEILKEEKTKAGGAATKFGDDFCGPFNSWLSCHGPAESLRMSQKGKT
ncbi:hypothetical protein ccbrp13_32430 [Ktedonobacteria bacterium brp13]|nr:hypothetical protein ccbrp13_32430 [Ktedonobacteria bacterium brp13]